MCGSGRAYTGNGIRGWGLGVYDRLMHDEGRRLAVLPVSIERCIDSIEKMSILFAINTRRRWLLVSCVHPQVVK